MKRAEIWFAQTSGGSDRPVLVLTRDPVAGFLGGVVVALITSTIRGHGSEMLLGIADGLKQDCVVSFDNIATIKRSDFRKRVLTLRPERRRELRERLDYALGCAADR